MNASLGYKQTGIMHNSSSGGKIARKSLMNMDLDKIAVEA